MRMKRKLMESLVAWKKDTEHRPLLLRGDLPLYAISRLKAEIADHATGNFRP